MFTSDHKSSAAKLIIRYAQRMLIENALSDAVRFFHMGALSSALDVKVDFAMPLLVIANGGYRLHARRMRVYAGVQARQIYRDLVNMSGTVQIAKHDIVVSFHRHAHLPIHHGLLTCSRSAFPCWREGTTLRQTAYSA